MARPAATPHPTGQAPAGCELQWPGPAGAAQRGRTSGHWACLVSGLEPSHCSRRDALRRDHLVDLTPRGCARLTRPGACRPPEPEPDPSRSMALKLDGTSSHLKGGRAHLPAAAGSWRQQQVTAGKMVPHGSRHRREPDPSAPHCPSGRCPRRALTRVAPRGLFLRSRVGGQALAGPALASLSFLLHPAGPDQATQCWTLAGSWSVSGALGNEPVLFIARSADQACLLSCT